MSDAGVQRLVDEAAIRDLLLAALEAPFGFQVLALPVRLGRASGAWARVVALVPAG